MDMDRFFGDAGHAILAAISGLIAAAMRKEGQSWMDYFIRMAGAALVGFLTAKLCRIAGASEDLSYVLTSLAGWVGAQAVMDGIRSKLGDKLGILTTEEKKHD